MAPTHTCPKRGCERELSDAVLACSRHWFMLPPELRRAIVQEWRRASGGDEVAVVHHLALVQDAILFWNGPPVAGDQLGL